MVHRFPSGIAYNGQGHQVRCVAFRSLFVKKSNHGAIVGHFCAGVGTGLYRMPDVVTTDRGTQFTSRDFELALSYHGVKQ
jgi:hypothetical protein